MALRTAGDEEIREMSGGSCVSSKVTSLLPRDVVVKRVHTLLSLKQAIS